MKSEIPFKEALFVWLKIAMLSFGGPAGQIAVMHRVLVEEKKWVSEDRFLHALNYCMLLPGPEAHQLATYIGWLLHRTLGGLTAGLLFIVPGFLSILGLSIIYAIYQNSPFVESLFFGLKAAVLAVVLDAVVRIGKRSLKNKVMLSVAVASFIAIFFFDVPFPIIILFAGACGVLGGWQWPDKFYLIRGHSSADDEDKVVVHTLPSWKRSIKISFIWICIWAAPLILSWYFLGYSHVLTTVGLFFSKAAVVTFGGAYAVLAYIAQEAVSTYHWLQPGEMLNGLGMAETTPGPLIQVVQYVGFLGAYRAPQPFSPMLAGVLGSIMTAWVTFTPCFLWIFLGAPSVEKLRGIKLFSAASSTISAAVVGVIFNLSIWFFLHVVFKQVEEQHWYGLRLFVPAWNTLNVPTLLIALFSGIALIRYKKPMLLVLGVSTLLGIGFYFL